MKALGLPVVVILPVAWFIQVRITQHSDGQRFAEADRKKQLVFSQIVRDLGAPLQTEDKNICYNSEQGPYDNGKLWCQTASAAYFSIAIPEATIKDSFVDIVKSNGWELSRQQSLQLRFNGGDGLTCQLRIDTGELATRTPLYFSHNPGSKQTTVVSCIGRAKAKHYHYIGG